MSLKTNGGKNPKTNGGQSPKTNGGQSPKIYKITCQLTGEVYYGSTTKSLEARFREHTGRMDCSSKRILKRSLTYGVPATMELVEEVADNALLLKRERHYIESFPCVNQVVPGRTRQERSEKAKLDAKKRSEANNLI
jgi:hypothetical protein